MQKTDSFVHPLLRKSYRPLFLAAMVYATVGMSVWLLDHLQRNPLPSLYGAGHWHAHELLYGVCLAALGGFLLQATANWSKHQTVGRRELLLLTILWLAGRLLHFYPDLLPAGVIAAPDLLFVLLLTALLATPLVATHTSHAYAVIEVMSILAVATIFGYWGWTDWFPDWGATSERLMLYALIAMLVMLAGKLIPGFTEKTLGFEITPRRSDAVVENTAIASLYLLMILLFIVTDGAITALVAAVCAVANGIRLQRWYFGEIWQHPLLWILYCGYGWIVAGFALLAAGMASLIPISAGIHALGAGGITVTATGMMVRVMLGNEAMDDGESDSWIVLAFILLNAAAAVVTLAALLSFGNATPMLVTTAAVSWSVAFAILTWRFSPALMRLP